jgi:hypothetical protein
MQLQSAAIRMGRCTQRTTGGRRKPERALNGIMSAIMTTGTRGKSSPRS